jgi:hypothetical protein
MAKKNKRMAILHLFIGIGAVFGGLAAILQPHSPMGISTDVLEGSPFENFLIPGLILFGFIGLGNSLAGIIVWRGSKMTGYISGFFGCGLIIWIIVQCWIMGDVLFLHILYLVLGMIQAILGLRMLFYNRQFPFSGFYK